MARDVAGDAIGRGATLALQQCTHVPRRAGHERRPNAPNLAGPVSRKSSSSSCIDYKHGDAQRIRSCRPWRRTSRTSDIDDLAAYYASLPKARPPDG